jgi:hypothetical protein
MTFEPQTHSEITSFQDVLDGNYKVLVGKSFAAEELLKTADPTSAMFKYYYDRMDGNSDAFVYSAEEGKSKMLDRENTLYFGESAEVNGDDRFLALKTTDAVYLTIGWAFQKGSKFTEYFNHHLHQMKGKGIMSKLAKKWKPKVCLHHSHVFVQLECLNTV